MKDKTANTFRVFLVVLVLAAIAYAPAIDNDFVFDDVYIIAQNSTVEPPLEPIKILTSNYWGNYTRAGLYRPLTLFSYAMQRSLHGLKPAAFHLVNLVLHLFCSLLSFFLIKKLTNSSLAALFTSLFFALHPVHSEAVINIVGRAELLAALFAAGAWLLHLKQDYSKAMPDKWRCAAFIVFTLGMFCKEGIVFIPLTILITDLIRPGTKVKLGRKNVLLKMTAVYAPLFLAPVVYFSVKYGLFGFLFHPQGYEVNFVNNPAASLSFFRRIPVFFRILGLHQRLFLWPFILSADYSFNAISISPYPLDALFWVGALFTPAMIGSALVLRKKSDIPILGFSIYFLTALPTANLLYPIGTIFGERLLYFPTLGYYLFLFGILCFIIEKTINSKRMVRGLFAFMSLVALLFTWRIIDRTKDWRNNESLWIASLKTHPNSPKLHFNFGTSLQRKDRKEEALFHYRKAVEIYPEYADALFNLASLLMESNEDRQALRFIEKYNRLNPNDPEGWNLKGLIHVRLEELEEARSCFLTAIRIDHQFARGWNNLGLLYLEEGRLYEAKETFNAALLRSKMITDIIYMHLGTTHYRLKNFDQAENLYRQALKINPSLKKARFLLGKIYDDAARDEEAFELYLKGAELDPDDFRFYYQLAETSFRMGRFDQAVRYYREALLYCEDERIISEIESKIKRLNRSPTTN